MDPRMKRLEAIRDRFAYLKKEKQRVSEDITALLLSRSNIDKEISKLQGESLEIFNNFLYVKEE